MPKLILRILLFSALTMAVQVILSLDYSRMPAAGPSNVLPGLPGGFKVGLPPLERYRPDSAILLFQSFMKSDAKVGFLFKENLGSGSPVRLQWADQEPGEIHSDPSGFINSPFAIAARKEGKPIHIIGVGSSFMQGAAEKFHDFFWAKGLFYYSMATPRHTLQQFTSVVKEYAVPLKPGWIVYDLNEASFELIRDYDEWSRTGQDWFAYHSGTWCGPPKKGANRLLESFPIVEALYAGVRRRIAPVKPIPPASDEELVRRALEEITEARKVAEANGIRFLVMTIPSRDVAVYGKSGRWRRVESLLPLLRKAGIQVLDLKPEFMAEDDPRALYFKVDAHWNGYGIFKAASAMARTLAESTAVGTAETSAVGGGISRNGTAASKAESP